MDALITHATTPLRGTLTLPADKAICHRAAFLCALATGTTTIRPWSIAEDCQRTLDVLQGLGVRIARVSDGIQVTGVGLTGLRAPTATLDCGDSGTTMRLSCGLLAGQPFVSRLAAGPSLSTRPMQRVIEPLSQMGARFEGTTGPHDVYPPLVITGRRPLQGLAYAMPIASAQVKSAILLAGLYAKEPTTMTEPVPTRDHTERLLAILGVSVRQKRKTVTLEPPQGALVAPDHLTIPGDPSSAAFFLVAAAIIPGSRVVIEHVGLNESRIAFLEILKRMGASVRWEVQDQSWEPRGTVTVEYHPLRATTIEPRDVPRLIDELPILMVAACAAEGSTRFEGLAELRVKETDRLRAITTGLRKLGARLETSGDASVTIARGPLQGTSVDSFQDHRTAMSLAIAGLLAAGSTRISSAECVRKSLGNFFELLAAVATPSSVTLVDASPACDVDPAPSRDRPE